MDSFTTNYLAAALFSSNDESDSSGGRPLDQTFTIDDFSPDAIVQATEECKAFMTANVEALREAGSPDLNGYDFWMTRNGHGTGFGFRDYEADVIDTLKAACKAAGERYVYVGVDRRLHFG